MSNLQQAFDSAVQAHQAGDLPRAEQLYRQVLTDDARHADALHLLGLLLRQQGNPEQAVAHIRQALQLRPDLVEAHYNLGNALTQLGKLAEAAASYAEAVRLRPSYVEAHNNLGNALKEFGRLEEAAASYREAVRLRPDQAGGHYNLARTLLDLRRFEEAEASLRAALSLQPDVADAWCFLGAACLAQGKLDEAEANPRRALKLVPTYAGAWNVLGVALSRKGALDEAVECFEELLRLQPDDAEGRCNLGVVRERQDRLDEAAACYREVLRVRPDHLQALNNLGHVLQTQGAFDEACACFREAIRLRTDVAGSHVNLGTACWDQGQVDDAVACYRQGLAIDPGDAMAHKNLALAYLLQGDFARGWPEYEWRTGQPSSQARPFAQPRWDGTPLVGRTLLLYAEEGRASAQGFGDTLHFIRYARRIPLGGRVILECQAPLVRLLTGFPGIDQILPTGSALPDFDVQAPLASLPGIFRTSLATIPAEIPYLTADANLMEHWGRKLESVRGFRVGIAWQGKPRRDLDRQRSVPLRQFAPLAQVDDVQLVSLQKGFGTEQLAEVAALFHVTDLAAGLEDFVDTAAVIADLDLVITVDSAVAHLAGALGAPVWVALPFLPDWRWLLGREDSPWYPTMRLFRQEKRGDWSGVFERMAVALRDVSQQQMRRARTGAFGRMAAALRGLFGMRRSEPRRGLGGRAER